jgi:predicted Zn-dependent peptidase
MIDGDANWENTYLDEIARVTPEQVREVARRCFAADAAVRLEVVPA